MSPEQEKLLQEAHLSPAQQETFKEAAKPLMAWMASNIHPHAIVVVDSTSAVLHEGLLNFSTEEFLGA